VPLTTYFFSKKTPQRSNNPIVSAKNKVERSDVPQWFRRTPHRLLVLTRSHLLGGVHHEEAIDHRYHWRRRPVRRHEENERVQLRGHVVFSSQCGSQEFGSHQVRAGSHSP